MAADSISISYNNSIHKLNTVDGNALALDSIKNLQELLKEANGAEPATDDLIAWSFFAFVVAMAIVLRVFRKQLSTPEADTAPEPELERSYHILSGSSIQFERHTLHKVLTKYFVYYRNLCHTEQNRFIDRLQLFIDSKTFVIPASEAYREMPILIGASAIQVTFGLKDFLLPWFEVICVHPREYILTNPLRTLAGNVQGNTITLSWKHFLGDYMRRDGVNVGLHEMAHALQMQYEYFYKRKGRGFRQAYDAFESIDDHIRALERNNHQPFYSRYALTNTDEFWACSVELFFERPNQLQNIYPQVYDVLKALLKQDLISSEMKPCIPL